MTGRWSLNHVKFLLKPLHNQKIMMIYASLLHLNKNNFKHRFFNC
jgi:hypothetical protein